MLGWDRGVRGAGTRKHMHNTPTGHRTLKNDLDLMIFCLGLTLLYFFHALFYHAASNARHHFIQENFNLKSQFLRLLSRRPANSDWASGTLSYLIYFHFIYFISFLWSHAAQNKYNFFWLFLFFFFLLLVVLDFHINSCLHLTFPKQVTAVYQNIIRGVFQWKTGVISCNFSRCVQ